MLCFRKSIRGKQLYKKKLKMLLQRSLNEKKLKQNKNGKTTVIMSCTLLRPIYIHSILIELNPRSLTIFSGAIVDTSLPSGDK